MAHDVFISLSSRDKAISDAVCAVLEAHRIRCWVAPRDIAPGAEWAESIIEAINEARCMVLVFSGHANSSPQVRREVERAVSKGIPIIPVRIEDVQPSKTLEYFISTPHWLDAFTPPLEQHLTRLAQAIRIILDHAVSRPSPTPETRPPTPDTEPYIPTRPADTSSPTAPSPIFTAGPVPEPASAALADPAAPHSQAAARAPSSSAAATETRTVSSKTAEAKAFQRSPEAAGAARASSAAELSDKENVSPQAGAAATLHQRPRTSPPLRLKVVLIMVVTGMLVIAGAAITEHLPDNTHPAAMEATSAATPVGPDQALSEAKSAYDRKNYPQALIWYRKAAALGNATAPNQLGYMYQNGLGVPQDFAQALTWYRKATALGNASAQDNLAKMYENGWGIAKDLDTARSWYQKAANNGNEHAKKWLVDHPA